MDMKNYIEGNWHQIKGNLRKNFGKITDNDWQKAEGNFEELLGSVQKAYALNKHEAEELLNKYISKDTLQIAKGACSKYIKEAESLIKDHPFCAILVAIVLGVCLGKK